MNNYKKILFLYSELGPYNIPVFKELVSRYKVNLHVVRWDKNLLKPYKPDFVEKVTYYNRSNLNNKDIKELIQKITPDLIYISGWMDSGYLESSLFARKKGLPVVTGFDDVWTGSMRQIFGNYFFKIYLHRYFSHAWVAGEPQYEYARRLGFPHDKILFDLLSANIDNFNNCQYKGLKDYFLYVGNFRKVKGIDILINAFNVYRTELNGKIGLKCIGNGELENKLKKNPVIETIGYTNQAELVNIASKSTAFILPSIHDQWGVVAHEFAAAGLPLILSTGVGSRSKFLINEFNGFSFKNGDYLDLASKMKKFDSMDSEKIAIMSENSSKISGRISPTTSAANLMSIFD